MHESTTSHFKKNVAPLKHRSKHGGAAVDEDTVISSHTVLLCSLCYVLSKEPVLPLTPSVAHNITHQYIYIYVYMCMYIDIYVHTYSYLFESLLHLRQASQIMSHHRRGTYFNNVRKIEQLLSFNSYLSVIDWSHVEPQNRTLNAALSNSMKTRYLQVRYIARVYSRHAKPVSLFSNSAYFFLNTGSHDVLTIGTSTGWSVRLTKHFESISCSSSNFYDWWFRLYFCFCIYLWRSKVSTDDIVDMNPFQSVRCTVNGSTLHLRWRKLQKKNPSAFFVPLPFSTRSHVLTNQDNNKHT
jgi:hypothetical protein